MRRFCRDCRKYNPAPKSEDSLYSLGMCENPNSPYGRKAVRKHFGCFAFVE